VVKQITLFFVNIYIVLGFIINILTLRNFYNFFVSIAAEVNGFLRFLFFIYLLQTADKKYTHTDESSDNEDTSLSCTCASTSDCRPTLEVNWWSNLGPIGN